jgi:hypothetical protein
MAVANLAYRVLVFVREVGSKKRVTEMKGKA